MSVTEKPDALAEIEAVLRRCHEDILALWDPREAEEDRRAVERGLTLLPRLREVVSRMGLIADRSRGRRSLEWAREQARAALAALEGGPDGA